MDEDDDLLHENKGRGGKSICCGIGTFEGFSCWCNASDATGLICSTFVLVFLVYVISVVLYGVYLTEIGLDNGIPLLILGFLAIWSHLKTMLSDPGAVPRNAHPIPEDIGTSVSVCGRCDAYKPPGSHHDRVSNRCVSRMDHFCKFSG